MLQKAALDWRAARLRSDRQLSGPDAGQRLVKVSVQEIVIRVALDALDHSQPRTGREQVAHWAQVLGIDLAEVYFRSEPVFLVDRVQMSSHHGGCVKHFRHQRFPDALL